MGLVEASVVAVAVIVEVATAASDEHHSVPVIQGGKRDHSNEHEHIHFPLRQSSRTIAGDKVKRPTPLIEFHAFNSPLYSGQACYISPASKNVYSSPVRFERVRSLGVGRCTTKNIKVTLSIALFSPFFFPASLYFSLFIFRQSLLARVHSSEVARLILRLTPSSPPELRPLASSLCRCASSCSSPLLPLLLPLSSPLLCLFIHLRHSTTPLLPLLILLILCNPM